MDKAYTLLLADDEESIRTVLAITLSDSGYSVLTAKDGREALRIFREKAPPIVLTDIKMPGMTGIELLRKIKEESPDTEVIVISGHGDMDLAIESLKHDAVDFVTKPINDDVLEIALKRAHERISMRDQLRVYTENLENLVEEQSAKLVEAERIAAISRAFEGLSSTIWDMAGDMEGGIEHFNEMPCPVAIHDRDSKIVTANQLFLKRFGDRIGENSWTIYRGRSGGADGCPVGRTLITGEGQRSNEVVVYVNNTDAEVIVHTAPIRNQKGDIELVLEISADINEVRQLQEAQEATQHNYQQLFDEVPCYITVQDKDFKLTAVNRRFKDDFDYGTGSFFCYHVYKHRSTPCPDCPVAQTFEDGLSHQSEMVVTSKHGNQYNVLISTAPIRNSRGEITRVMEMSTNITEIRQLQDHLSSLGLKIGTISHGLKGILTGMDGGTYEIDTGLTKGDPDRVKEGWDTVKLMVGRIRNMALDILYYAKERDLKWEQVDVLSFAKDVAMTIEKKTRDHAIEFLWDFDPSVGVFEIDASVVRTALINILENAIDACLEDKANRSKQITFAAAQNEKDIVFTVSDNGVGMDEGTRENLFNLFFSSKGSGGTGLGLYISNQIVRQHGGTINVNSKKGTGSDFHLRIPKVLPEFVKEENRSRST